MKRARLLAAAALLTLSSCQLLGNEVTYVDPETGEEVTTTVGDALADQIDQSTSIVSNTAGKAVGVATGNPVVGVSAAALLSALIGTGTSRLRRRRKTAPGDGSGEQHPSA